MQARQDERKQIAEVIGGGQIYESLSDKIMDDLNNPRAEILGIDMSEYSTTKESIIPPDIIKFAEKETFFGRFTSRIRRMFGRK